MNEQSEWSTIDVAGRIAIVILFSVMMVLAAAGLACLLAHGLPSLATLKYP